MALRVVEIEPGANTGFGLAPTRIGVEVDLLVFEASPQPLDEDVVHAPALAIHANGDPMILQRAGEILAGELTALVGIEDLGPAVSGERLLERLDTKIGAERVRQPPRQ